VTLQAGEKSNDALLEGERDSIAKWLKIEQIKSWTGQKYSVNRV